MSLRIYKDYDGETFEDTVTGEVWGHRFDMVFNFYGGYAVVRLSRFDDNSYTLVDEHGMIWKQRRFADIHNSFGDSVLVQLKNGSWVCADKKTGRLGKQRFKFAEDFERGIAKVVLKNKYIYLNSDGVECPEEYVKKLREIYYHPKTFLDLPTKTFSDEKFINLAVSQIRFSLNHSVGYFEEHGMIDEKYVKQTRDLLASIKEKIEKENRILKGVDPRREEQKKARDELLEDIDTLGV